MLNKQHTKFIGLDYGKKRTGISISDYKKIISFPLDTINTNDLVEFLRSLTEKEKIEKIIIGKPFKLNNELHELENDILELIKSLKLSFPEILIDRVDERYTSKISTKIINELNTKQKKRRDKSIIDKISASLILESYLIKTNK